MSTSQSTIDFLLDQLSDAGPVTVRKMFGEYCLYFAGKPIGLVCDNQLFLKNTPAVRALVPAVVEAAPYPKARPHLLISADLWDERQSLGQWVRATAEALPDAPPKPPKAARTPRTPRTPRAGKA